MNIKARLQEIEQLDNTPQEKSEYRRQLIVESAVSAAERILLDHTDGSVEELNYLTAKVAEVYVDKVIGKTVSALLKYDFDRRKT